MNTCPYFEECESIIEKRVGFVISNSCLILATTIMFYTEIEHKRT